MIIGILGVVFGFSLVNNEKIIYKIIHRVMSTGDIYYMLYINNNINKIEAISMLDYYVVSILRPILKHIITLRENVVLGYQAIEIVYNIQTKEFGPNARYDVVWQLNLGWISILGGYLNATIIAFMRRIRTNNFYILNLILFLLVNLDAILGDFILFGNILFSVFLCFIPLVIITEIIFKMLEK